MTLQGKVIEKINAGGPKVRAIFQDAMKDASTHIMEQTIREAPGSIGVLRKSIRREIGNDGLRAEIFPSVRYGESLHGPFEGGGTHSPPRMIPAREAAKGGSLYRWAKKKGINPYAVRMSISKKGVKYNKYMKRAAEKGEGKVREIFETGIDLAVKLFAD